ncbi:hypothetical protein [Chitinophaga sp. S165]|uniref:hypothetical protein n=1 Tax=Chitinophaga sp. S165 TaxID=2135462 RepID=UPI000D71094E|nr:hypothetical protein [Chitinophaga sp. S165]PWV55600.1 hypothetical protein C7475_101106 [Chitinophaga sp. S165]
MDNLQYKDTKLLNIYDEICAVFGSDFFSLPDFWDGDNFAMGLINHNKLIYISAWDGRDCPEDEMKYFAEFEIIDMITSETITTEKSLEGIGENELIKEMIAFVTDRPEYK